MNWIRTSLLALVLLGAVVASADDVVRERPAEWKNLVRGGQFKDLFLPMPMRDGMTSDTWGGDNVKPRDVTNGIEDPAWSYWCAYPHRSGDGKYHLFTARWPQDEPRGHFGYFDSMIVRAEAEDPMGPYHVVQTIGPGHNPELYRTARGQNIVYSTHGRFYYADSLEGPWKAGTYNFDKRGRYAFKNYVNFSFAPRDDGSFIAVSRRGYIWASRDGGDDWEEVSSESVYPKVPGIFEDPVMWKDDVQYHIIVNDWKGRIAYHLRSKDGFHWKAEDGEAYVPGIARYEDDSSLDWYKYERIRFLRDEHGRPYMAFFAVIDTDKHSDLPNDAHNSKSIAIPVQKARLIEVLNEKRITASTQEIRVRIHAESDFDPHTDIDLESIRFGASNEVNYGHGCRLRRAERSDTDLVLVFDGSGSGFAKDSFAGKLLGSTTDGNILFGWCRLPEVVYKVPVLSSLAPVFEYTDEELEAYVEVQNFGQAASERTTVKVLIGDPDKRQLLAIASVRGLKPFEKSIVRLVCNQPLPRGRTQNVTVLLQSEGLATESFTRKVALPN